MGNYYENQALKLRFNIGKATTETTDIILKYKKPIVDSEYFEEGERTDVLVENASTGDVYVDIENDFLTPVGKWTFWSYVTTIDENEFPGNPWSFPVLKREGISITNKDFVKTILKITGTDDDAIIDSYIPLAEADYLRIRKAPWAQNYNSTTEELNNIYPPGANITVAKMIGYMLKPDEEKELSAEKTMSYSWNKDTKMIGGYPAHITSSIDTFITGA